MRNKVLAEVMEYKWVNKNFIKKISYALIKVRLSNCVA